MERLRIWILLAVVLPGSMLAQQRQTEYNRKGDEAMKSLDYSDARMWYEEGATLCDPYSVDQLTEIWQNDKAMRSSMRSLMNKCMNCLTVRATENDTTAISQLIVYYAEGIGTPVSEELAAYWTDRLETLRQPAEPVFVPIEKSKKPKEPMKFFVGYAYSIEAPFGLTVGGVGDRLGWYARFRSSFSSQDYTNECRADGVLIESLSGNPSFEFTQEQKKNCYAATAGLVVKCTPWLFTSIGLGYGKRDLICQFITHDKTNYNKSETIWSKNIDYSYTGLAADWDVMVKLGPVFVSAGCNTLNFKYVDLNAGLGVFF